MRNRTDCLSATLGGFKEKKIYKWFEATPVGKFRPELGWIPCNPDKIIYTILQDLISCAIFLASWFCFYLYNRHEASIEDFGN